MEKAKLFIGLIISPNVDTGVLDQSIEEHFGLIERKSQTFDFSHTSYYQKEMGVDLRKQFYIIKPLISTCSAYKEKVKSVSLERQYLKNGNRLVNIDPGILTAHNVILLTTKNYAHRIPLNQDIYAELTYVFKEKKYSVLPWSYPDFGTEDYISFFEEVRKLYLKESDRLT